MNEKLIQKYNELVKKHELLNERYAKLESLEKELEENTSLSEDVRLKNLNKLADEYEKIATLMQEITEEAKKLNESIE